MSNSSTPLIALFVELQKKDSELDDYKRQSQLVPGEISVLKQEVETKKNEFDAQKEALKRHILKRKELESELQAKEALIKKHQLELNQVKTNDAFKALLAEIATIKKEADDIETGILSCLEESDNAAQKEKVLLGEFKQAEARIASQITGLEAKKTALDQKTAELEAARQNFCAQLEPDALARYEHLRTQRGGIAISPVKKQPNGFSCGGCNMLLTPQVVVNLSKKDIIVVCDNCQRIIYSPDILKETAAQPQ